MGRGQPRQGLPLGLLLVVMAVGSVLLVDTCEALSWSGWSLPNGVKRSAREATAHGGVVDACSGDKWFLAPHCVLQRMFETCPLRNGYEKSLLGRLEESLVGQEAALALLSSALLNGVAAKPTIIHIAGENGVGKTRAAMEVCRSKFLLQTEAGTPDGMLYIRGSLYKFDPKGIIRLQHALDYEKKVDELKQGIFKLITEQLMECPRSVIVFDEYTVPNKDVMPVLEQFMDGQPVRLADGKQLVTAEATFLFISDFGSEGFTHGMSQREMEQCIDIDMKKTWGPSLFHTQHLTTLVVPFQPMDIPLHFDPVAIASHPIPSAVVELVGRLLKALPETLARSASEVRVGVSAEEVEKVARFLYRYQVSSEMYRYRNYRGITQLFQTKVANEFRLQFDGFVASAKSQFLLIDATLSTQISSDLNAPLDLVFSFKGYRSKPKEEL